MRARGGVAIDVDASTRTRGKGRMARSGARRETRASARARASCARAWTVNDARRARWSTRARARTEREREVEEVTKKWGLEAGLWRVWKSDAKAEGGGDGENPVGESLSRMDMAKNLLKRYGSAYLATSISLSLISITVFYFLVAGGIDVAALLEKIGITVNATSEQFGTFALAYAAHKASSPIRFGPTVALTPLVARWMGKDVDDAEERTTDETDGGAP